MDSLVLQENRAYLPLCLLNLVLKVSQVLSAQLVWTVVLLVPKGRKATLAYQGRKANKVRLAQLVPKEIPDDKVHQVHLKVHPVQ